MNVYEVIQGPLITEKSTDLKEEQRTLCFKVARGATKTEVRKAVEAYQGQNGLDADGIAGPATLRSLSLY